MLSFCFFGAILASLKLFVSRWNAGSSGCLENALSDPGPCVESDSARGTSFRMLSRLDLGSASCRESDARRGVELSPPCQTPDADSISLYVVYCTVIGVYYFLTSFIEFCSHCCDMREIAILHSDVRCVFWVHGTSLFTSPWAQAI